MASICSSNVTSGFIDLATFDEIEKYMYGGQDATAYFVRETRKSTWFTQVPVVLSSRSSTPAFGNEWSVTISRAGDYLLQTWLRVTIPAVTLKANNQFGYCGRLRWTRNLMHNLIKDACITFNDLVASRIDNYFLDFWTAFTVPAGKRNGYNNMIGNNDSLTSPHCVGDTIPSTVLNLPLPFWYSRDSGVALPTAALPYNEMRINFSFRNWTELLILDNTGVACSAGADVCGTGDCGPYDTCCYSASALCDASALCEGTPVLGNTQVWANYAIVSNDERKRMACAPRDILIEQTQLCTRQAFNPCTNKTPSYDLRFSHAIKVLFFGVRNTTTPSEWSNYTTASPVVLNADKASEQCIDYCPAGAFDPIATTSLVYENTQRLAAMGSDYFSLINPYYHAPVIPYETGYHMYSYSLDFICLDPMGSTNYGKLTNVSIIPEASDAAVLAASIDCTAHPPACAGETGPCCDNWDCDTGCPKVECLAVCACDGDCNYCRAAEGLPRKQTFEFICCAVNNNIIRISGGALGFPVL